MGGVGSGEEGNVLGGLVIEAVGVRRGVVDDNINPLRPRLLNQPRCRRYRFHLPVSASARVSARGDDDVIIV